MKMGKQREIRDKSDNNSNDDTSDPEQKLSINDLPPEILIKIIGYLKPRERIKVERVCKHWRSVAPKAWQMVNELDIATDLTDEFATIHSKSHTSIRLCTKSHEIMQKIMSLCGCFVTKFGLYGSQDLAVLPLVRRFCPNIYDLKVEIYPGANVKGLNRLFRKRPNLKSVTVSACTANSVRDLYYVCKENLENLEIKCISGKRTAEKLSNYLRQLQTLKSLHIPIHPTLLKTAGSMNITSLTLNNFFSTYEVCSEIYYTLRLSNLEVLDIWELEIPDDFFIKLAERCKKIKKIVIGENSVITVRGLNAIASLPELEELNVSGVEAFADENLAKLTQVRKLDCTYCCLLTTRAFITLVENSTRLEEILISYEEGSTEKFVNAAIAFTERRASKILNILFSWELECLNPRKSSIILQDLVKNINEKAKFLRAKFV